jgi:hypothetical protein
VRVTAIPIVEGDGVLRGKRSFGEDNKYLQLMSHEEETLIELRLLNSTMTVDLRSLQSAIQSVTEDRSKSKSAVA